MPLIRLLKRIFQHDLNGDDLVVFVVGPSGGGKSWAATSCSGLVSVSHKLKPCTEDVVAVRCDLTDQAKKALNLYSGSTQKSIVFVDMPSFHTGLENGAETKVTKWLKNLKYASTLVGTVYMDRVETDHGRQRIGIQHHLNTFARTFPQDVKDPPDRLLAVLSYESNLCQSKIDSHMKEFGTQVTALHASIMKGAKHKLTWRATLHQELFRKDPNDPTLVSNMAWNVIQELLSAI